MSIWKLFAGTYDEEEEVKKEPCPGCKGKGYVRGSKCGRCDGEGSI